jgi:hypothetical protein
MNDWIADDYETPTYLDSLAFKRYAAAIEEIIQAGGPEGVTTRTIHETLGPHARRDWTADAIESLRTVEPVGMLPTKWRYAPIRRGTYRLDYVRRGLKG